jgi:hypothetical protein
MPFRQGCREMPAVDFRPLYCSNSRSNCVIFSKIITNGPKCSASYCPENFFAEKSARRAPDQRRLARMVDGGQIPDRPPWFVTEYVADHPGDRVIRPVPILLAAISRTVNRNDYQATNGKYPKP